MFDLSSLKRTISLRKILLAVFVLALACHAASADLTTDPGDDIRSSKYTGDQSKVPPTQSQGLQPSPPSPSKGKDPNQSWPEQNNRFPPAMIIQTQVNCAPTTVSLCNAAINIPFIGVPGSLYTVAMPSPNQDKAFSVQCVNLGSVSVYQIVSPETIACAVPRCPSSAVSLCGASIPLNAGASVGETLEVPLPASVLGANSTYNHPSFKAACIANPDGTAKYQISDVSGVSCNVFPCADTSVRLCETSVPIKGGANLGDVLHLTMPAPFNEDPFDVSCVGTLGQQPVYQVTDSSGITCTKTTPARR